MAMGLAGAAALGLLMAFAAVDQVADEEEGDAGDPSETRRERGADRAEARGDVPFIVSS